MANADRRSGATNQPLSRTQSRLLLTAFFAITVVLAFVAARAIINDTQNPLLQQRIEEMRERKNQNSLFAPTDTTGVPDAGRPAAGTPDTSAAH